jgi:hypothetical protein
MCYHFCDTKMGIARQKSFFFRDVLSPKKNRSGSTIVVVMCKARGMLTYLKSNGIGADE